MLNKKKAYNNVGLYIKIKKINYYFSWCIANLGVVPLFLFAAFLLAPLFFFLLALLVFVILVNETIFYLHQIYTRLSIINFRSSFLVFWPWNVKINLLGLYFLLKMGGLYAQTTEIPREIILSRGEIKEIPLPELIRFSVGNSEIIGHKTIKIKNDDGLLIKGKKIGMTEIMLWVKKDGEKAKRKIKIFVISKRKQLKILQFAQTLNNIGIKAEVSGEVLKLDGKISSSQHLKLIKDKVSKFPEYFISNLTIVNKLEREIAEEIYKYFYMEGAFEISCEFIGININCFHYKNTKVSKEIYTLLKDKYNINFLYLENNHRQTNYKLMFKVIMLENYDGSYFNLGINQIKSSFIDLYKYGNLYNNQIHIGNIKLNSNVISSPSITLAINQKAHIDLGSNNEELKSKISVKAIIKTQGNKILLEYETNISGPGKNNINNLGKSSIFILPSKTYQIFDAGIYTNEKEEKYIPIIGSIPLIGSLFKSNNTKVKYKKIIGVLTIKQESYY